MMKKGLYAILAALAVFAFVLVGCGDGGGTKEPEKPIDPEVKWTAESVEEVTLSNASQVVYRFVLPEGKKWSDYDGLSADYLVPWDGTGDNPFEVSNSGRTQRIYGNYDLDFFLFNTTTKGTAYAYASLDGNANNNEYILDDTGNGGWKSLADALAAELGDCPAENTWFTINYKTDGSRANVKPHKHLPDANATTVIFGLGLPGQGEKNTIQMKNVFLKNKDGATGVVGSPLFISKDGVDYPAYSAYGTDGGSGEDNLSRKPLNGAKYEPAVAAPVPDTVITFNLNAGTDASAVFVPADFAGTKAIFKGKAIGTLPSAKRTDYLFEGWAVTATGTEAITTTKTFDANATLYAIWKADAAEGTPIPVSINNLTLPPPPADKTIGTVDPVTGGFKYTYGTADYERALVWFKIDFAAAGITDIKKIKKVQFDYTPIAGDFNYKPLRMISNPEAISIADGTALNGVLISDTVQSGGVTANTATTLTVTLDPEKITATQLTNFFSIFINAGVGTAPAVTTYSITNIKLIPFAN